MGEHARLEPVHGGCDRGSGDAVGDLDSIRTVPRRDERDGDPGNTGERVRSGTDCCDRFRRVEAALLDNRGAKSLEPRDVANAAAFTTPPGSDVPREQNLDDCSARLSCSGGRPRSRQDYHAGHEQLNAFGGPCAGDRRTLNQVVGRAAMAVTAHRLRLEYRIQRATSY